MSEQASQSSETAEADVPQVPWWDPGPGNAGLRWCVWLSVFAAWSMFVTALITMPTEVQGGLERDAWAGNKGIFSLVQASLMFLAVAPLASSGAPFLFLLGLFGLLRLPLFVGGAFLLIGYVVAITVFVLAIPARLVQLRNPLPKASRNRLMGEIKKGIPWIFAATIYGDLTARETFVGLLIGPG